MTLENYEDALAHMWTVQQLNEKGLNEYIGVLHTLIQEYQQKIINLEHQLSYSKKEKGK